MNLKSENRFKVAVIENFRWSRGTDRIVEIAQELHKLNEKRVVFIVAGDMSIPKHLDSKLSKYSNLKDYIYSRGLSNYFIFLGHVKNPEEVIFECDILSSLSRRAGPWGRSVVEAMQLEKPVISVGENKGLVINNNNGIHINKYKPEDIVSTIIYLIDNKKEYENLSRGAKLFITTYFDSEENSNKIFSIWEKAISINNYR
jgi:glycosyltransferase involved in cell wall biosynthesis